MIIKKFSAIVLLSAFIIALFETSNSLSLEPLRIDCSRSQKVHENFISVSVDSSVFVDGLQNFNTSNPKLKLGLSSLRPAYFRIGGTMADALYFLPNSTSNPTNYVFENFNLTGDTWLKIYNLAEEAGVDVLFCLNSVVRYENGSWNPENAEQLISFSQDNNLNVDWELGNEPDIYEEQYGITVNATQLAEDFITLNNILKKYPKYNTGRLVGPDLIRPIVSEGTNNKKYLYEFLENVGDAIKAATWHHYYFNGADTNLNEFLNPTLFDGLIEHITGVRGFIDDLGLEVESWMGETSSAWGGGAQGLSDRFVATFNWLDKLGLAAKLGVKVVVRQSIIATGYYGLLDNNYDPNPDWWLTVLYKQLVGNTAFNCSLGTNSVRVYCHLGKQENSIVVYGINLNNDFISISLENTFSTIHHYELTGELLEKNISLNGNLLQVTENGTLPDFSPMVHSNVSEFHMKPYSISFWEIPQLLISEKCNLA